MCQMALFDFLKLKKTSNLHFYLSWSSKTMKVLKSLLPELSLNYKTSTYPKVKITCSGDAFNLLQQVYDLNTIDYIETVVVLFLNRANNTLGWMRLSHGGQSGCVVDGKVLFASALQCGASSIIVSHNHPSGELQPSDSDNKLTARIVEVGKYLDLQVLDHLIVSRYNYYSFADEGKI